MVRRLLTAGDQVPHFPILPIGIAPVRQYICPVKFVPTYAAPLALVITLAGAAHATPPARTRLLSTNVTLPIGMAGTPADPQHMYVCERAGSIAVIDRDTGARSPGSFLDITSMVNLEDDDGLLGLAFDPDYANNGFFYINYTRLDGNIVLARYHATPGATVSDSGSAYTIWSYPRPRGHNGGWIGFSPVNGYLYITSGDGDLGGLPDPARHAQNLVNEQLGKILRIDPHSDDFPSDPDRNYHIPPSNPFVGITGDDEIWGYGVRNPWRGSFDRANGDFYFGDVGMDSYEEVDYEPASSPGARNYGWPCMEGTHCSPNDSCTCGDPSLTLPVYDYPHPTGNSVTGGYVYRGSTIPALQGVYIFADFIRSKVWSFRIQPGGGGYTEFADRTSEFIPAGTTSPVSQVATFGEDVDGELYLANIFASKIYKVVPYPCAPVVDLSPAPQSHPIGATIIFRVLGAGADPLTFRWRKNGVNLNDGGRIQGALTPTLTISSAVSFDSGNYDVVLSSPCGPDAISNTAQLTIFGCTSADVNASGTLTVQDLFDFLAYFFSNDPRGDFNQSGQTTVQDMFDFLFSYFSGCQ
jgi:glucose/arabinose dehydrogenase